MAGDALVGVDGGGEHDGAAPGAQVGQDGAEAEEAAGDVDGELPLPGFEGQFVGGRDVDGVGIADQQVHGAVAVGGAQYAVPVRRCGDVGADEGGPAAAVGDPPGDGPAGRLGDVGEHHGGSFLREALGRGGSDAGGRSGDHGRTAVVAGAVAWCGLVHRGVGLLRGVGDSVCGQHMPGRGYRRVSTVSSASCPALHANGRP
ncbi:hypothetical protein SHKM778_52140 [Streptomyces sp. KM77-8]|uniref:Uncharacterized protein n=1 Tax=Streptomyces haneummycinicus TaxID=3074435 RepID=A0AAT9HN12_9ACTN